ncbi:MAG: GNAT family N-acetyltransferase [Psychrobium sp.]|nr:GNAT family N-acetyltransferase [Psychrobium sp.]
MEFNGLFIKLRKIEPEDIDLVVIWLNSDEFKKNLYSIRTSTESSCSDVVVGFIKENADDFKTNKYLIIESKSSGKAIGLVFVNNIDWKNRNAEYNYIIGDESNRNGVYGGDTAISVCYYLFNHLNLNKIIGYTYEFNKKAQRINNYGSKLEGVLKQHHRYGGQYIDVFINGLTRTNFELFLSQHKNSLLRKHYNRGIFK